MAGEGFHGGTFGSTFGDGAFGKPGAPVPPGIGPRNRNRSTRRPAEVRLGEAVPDIWEQEGFRFRNDDGSETTATWLAAQDVNISRVINTPARLRMLVNVTGDPSAKQFQLEFRKVGEAEFRRIQ